MEIILYDCHSNSVSTIKPEIPPALTLVKPTEIPLAVPHSINFKYLGYLFLLLAITGTAFVGLPVVIPAIQSKLQQKAPVFPVQTTFGQVLNQQEEASRILASEEAKKYGVDTTFSIVIPKISATAKIIPNVNPADEEAYRNALKIGVAHAEGSKLPGGGGTIYLFAHSTNSLANVSRYNAVFYQLKDIEADDKIIIFFAGKKYIYQVTSKQIVAANDTQWLTSADEERLILQTCWPPGTSLKRLIVVARPV